MATLVTLGARISNFIYYRAFSPLVIVGMASPILVAMVIELKSRDRRVHNPILSQIRFVYNPMGGVQLPYTKWVTHSFSMVGCKY